MRIGNINDLPDELKQQLSKEALEGTNDTQMIFDAIKELDGQAHITEIMVVIYRQNNKIIRRMPLQHKLSRLVNRGELSRIKPGWYKL